jgi:hypothetical protein
MIAAGIYLDSLGIINRVTIASGIDLTTDEDCMVLDYEIYRDVFTGQNYHNYYFNRRTNEVLLKPTQPDDVSVFNTITEQWEYSDTLYNSKLEQQKQLILANRLQLLQASDWTDTVSAQTRLGDLLYQAWQDYRQALRDITLQPNYPLDVIWPIAP